MRLYGRRSHLFWCSLERLCVKGGCVVESREAFEMFRGVATCGEMGIVQGLLR